MALVRTPPLTTNPATSCSDPNENDLCKSLNGVTWEANFRHVALRCLKLFLFGTALHCVYAGRLVWELWNVLTQLSVTIIIAYLIIRKSVAFQISFSILLLLLTEVLHRFVLMPGYDQPFVESKNFGTWFDLVLMGKSILTGGLLLLLFQQQRTVFGVFSQARYCCNPKMSSKS